MAEDARNALHLMHLLQGPVGLLLYMLQPSEGVSSPSCTMRYCGTTKALAKNASTILKNLRNGSTRGRGSRCKIEVALNAAFKNEQQAGDRMLKACHDRNTLCLADGMET